MGQAGESGGCSVTTEELRRKCMAKYEQVLNMLAVSGQAPSLWERWERKADFHSLRSELILLEREYEKAIKEERA